MPKACFNCVHLETYDHPGDRENPPDSGWDCKLEMTGEDWAMELMDTGTDDEVMLAIAKQCPKYEFLLQNPGFPDELFDVDREGEILSWLY